MKNYIDYIINDSQGHCGKMIERDYMFIKECNEALVNFDKFVVSFINHPKLPKYVKSNENYIKEIKHQAELLAKNEIIANGGIYDEILRFKFTFLVWAIIWH